MPIGAAKLGVLGAGLVPGGTETFNAPGTFSIPPGVKKVSITGTGGSGNPGNSGTAGNPGNLGFGGGGGGGGGGRPASNNLDGTVGGLAYSATANTISGSGAAGGQMGITGPPGNDPLPCFAPNPGGTGGSGTGGSAGSAGSAGNPGQSSSGLGNTFPGGAAGNAGNAGAAGTGGSGGSGGGGGVIASSTGTGGSGGNGGGAGQPGHVSPVPVPPLSSPQSAGFGGSGGGGAGATNNGQPGNNLLVQPNDLSPPARIFIGGQGGRGGTTACYNHPVDPNWTSANSEETQLTRCGPLVGVNDTGGPGAFSTRIKNSSPTFIQSPAQTGRKAIGGSCQSLRFPGNTPGWCARTPAQPGVQAVRSGGGGGRGGGGSATASSCPRQPGGGGGGGGGRGNAGNAGGAGGAGGTGGAGTTQTFNCVPVTPGGTSPITVASPGGQIVISWNPQ